MSDIRWCKLSSFRLKYTIYDTNHAADLCPKISQDGPRGWVLVISQGSPGELTLTTVPHVLREKKMLTWVPLDTPRQEVLVRKSSKPPTSSLGTFTSMAFDLHTTGTVGEGRGYC